MFPVSVPFRGFFNLKADGEILKESPKNLFQSPSGDSLIWKTIFFLFSLFNFKVSVPFRGFFNLKAASASLLNPRILVFQSPSGDSLIWKVPNFIGNDAMIGIVSVPFRGFFNLKVPLHSKSIDLSFEVSVPFRGFFNLKALLFLLLKRQLAVSVPFRGFFNLKAPGPPIPPPGLPRFSPLPGIL